MIKYIVIIAIVMSIPFIIMNNIYSIDISFFSTLLFLIVDLTFSIILSLAPHLTRNEHKQSKITLLISIKSEKKARTVPY